MLRRLIVSFLLVITTAGTAALAQNTNSSTTGVRPRTATTNTNQSSPSPAKNTDVQKPTTTAPAARRTQPKPKVAATTSPGSGSVAEAFNALLNGIRNVDADAVNRIYWNSPRLLLFNSNGSVTKGWEQMRRNRESSYKDVKDVKLDVRDVSITMLGRDGAVVSCLWTQSQTYKGAPDTASGRMTLVFKRIGKDWKVIHLHTSDPSRAIQPERASPSPSP
jgi:ketosteroid isomerase-like protein